MLTRREFLRSAGATGLAALVSPRLFRTEKLDRIGVQLYMVRGALQQDFEGTLRDIAAIGFREVEFAGYFGRTPSGIAMAVKRWGMTAPGSHITYERLITQWTRTLDEASGAGHDFVVLPWVPEEVRKTADDWSRLAELLNRSGHAARAAGLRLAYHNQVYDFAPVDGVTPFDRLAAATDPDALAFELDVYWCVKSGGDPIAALERYPGRFPLIHAKDAGPAPERKMMDVGSGTVDWKAVLSHKASAGIEHVFVEHDEPANPFTSAATSYRYLRRLSF